MAVLVLFFVSGLTALVYELLWVRLLTLVLGNTVEATTTVLAAFMAGLALGSLVVGHYLDRSGANPLSVYAALEAGIALFALAFPALLDLMVPVYRAMYQSSGGGGAWLSGVRFLACFLGLLLPTTLMGGTLPALAKHLVHRRSEIGLTLGLVYGVNTLGGVTGVLLCGFALIPAFGPRGANLRAVALTLLVALAAWVLSRRAATPAPAPAGPMEDGPPATGAAGREGSIVLAAYFASGLVALALEVVWTRLLVLVFGSTTHAFTIMLATFLTGIALGSAIARRWVDRLADPTAWLGGTLIVCAALVSATASLVDALPYLYLRLLTRLGFTWLGDVGARTIVSVALMLPATLLFGATFPLAARTRIAGLDALGRGVGRIYAANTVGAILGSLLAGFLLLPWLGMQRSLQALFLLLAAAGMAPLLARRRSRPRLAFAAAAAAVLVFSVAVTPRWDRMLLSAGAYMSPSDFIDAQGGVRLDEALAEQRLLYFQEGRTATVAVTRDASGLKTFKVDGKSEISTLPADKRLGRLLSHLPMLVHPDPQSVINIGLGAGMTVAGLAAHPAAMIQVAEIEPLVRNATRLFADENDRVLDDPRVRVVFNDGRNHVLLTADRYDVIASDPFEPTVGGAASLFTEDHFAAMRDRLRPGGIASQYVPLYEMEWPEWGSILRSFVRVFPHVTVWATGSDAILLGSREHLVLDFARVKERLERPEVRAQLHDVGLDDASRIAASYLFEIEGGDGALTGVPVNSDDHPYVEFAAPQRRWTNTIGVNLARLMSFRQPLPGDAVHPDEAARVEALRFRAAQDAANAAQIAAIAGDMTTAEQLARKAHSLDPGNRLAAEVLVGWHFMSASDPAAALPHLEAAAALDPEGASALLALAWARLRAGDRAGARASATRLLELYPGSGHARVCLARIAALEGNTAEAERHLAAALAEYPRSPTVLAAAAELRAPPARVSP